MKRAAGLILLICVVIIVAVAIHLKGNGAGPNAPGGGGSGSIGGSGTLTVVKGLVGGEKQNFLKNPEVVQALREKYGLSVEFDRRGSIEMAQQDTPPDTDFLWPSSQVALDIYKESKRPLVQADIVFNSPIVIYSWATVTDALIKVGVVRQEKDAYFIVDFPKLIQLINSGKQWKDLGLPQLYGRIVLYSTDPTKSNSGNMFSGLLANVLNNGAVATDDALPKVLPTVKRFFDEQGYMESSSDVIFTQFLNKGMGDKPLIIGYEAQLIEYSIENAQALAQRKEAVRILYPKPTVWSSHPLIALNDKGKKLIEALQDKDIQRLAWEKHGFRSATGANNDLKALKVTGIPETIETVVPMPSAHVMEAIIRKLGGK